MLSDTQKAQLVCNDSGNTLEAMGFGKHVSAKLYGHSGFLSISEYNS